MLYDTDYKRAKPPKNHVLVLLIKSTNFFGTLCIIILIGPAYTVKVDITDSSGQAQNPLYRDNPFYRKSDVADSENV